MNKLKALKPVNCIMILDFICLIVTALSDDVIPHDVYRVLHPVFGYVFLACVVIHVFLNWGWIRTNVFGSSK